MNAVRSASIAQGVFLPSFPVEQMSLDDLEHAALFPRRLRDRVQKADRTTPFLTRLFTPHLQKADLEPNHKAHLMSRKVYFIILTLKIKHDCLQNICLSQWPNDAHIQSVFPD